MMKQRWLLLLSVLFLAACSTTTYKLDEYVNPGWVDSSGPESTLMIVRRPPTDFLNRSTLSRVGESTAMALGPFAVWATLHSLQADMKKGATVIAKHQLEDPGLAIAQQMASLMEQYYQIKNLGVGVHLVESTPDESAEILRLYGDATYALVVGGIFWSLNSVDKSERIGIRFAPVLQIYDTAKGELVVQASCLFKPADSSPTFTKASLAANEGPVLKAELARVVYHCVDVFSNKLALAQPSTQ